jgi:hypothetical protein
MRFRCREGLIFAEISPLYSTPSTGGGNSALSSAALRKAFSTSSSAFDSASARVSPVTLRLSNSGTEATNFSFALSYTTRIL